MKRAVITGCGVVTPLGNKKEVFWDNIKCGTSGVDLITTFDSSNLPCKVAAKVKDFDPTNYMEKKDSRRMDLFVQYAVAAALMAVEDSKIVVNDENSDRVGVIIGSGIGGITTFEEQYKSFLIKGPNRVSPFFIPMLISNMGTGQVSIFTGAKGMNLTTVSACASGADAVGQAALTIARGDADVMIAGGAEASVSMLPFIGFCAMKAMSTRNVEASKACSPFDANRDGFVMGDGAGVLIIEELEYAKKRNADIIAEIVGYSSTNDAYHITAPLKDGSGAARCMSNALIKAQLSPESIDYINAHGTSTHHNDKAETIAIKKVFGDYSYEIPISSTKSMTGHLLGAAGAIETIITAFAINENFLPPTINYEVFDPECDLDYVPNLGRYKEINYAISNSFGFGGHNACIVLKKYIS
ncbi:MAG: beta-ketoacyl-ACP synthase II [Clostridiales bacterium]|jgi:3-oxoacyl-[acyl-carrier-protein] synthase II|nr:beta-ketoacyl-ACP synthase II [Clostridiales bacterium]